METEKLFPKTLERGPILSSNSIVTNLRPLPPEAEKLCRILNAPARLVAHLSLVHDAACDLVAGLQRSFPTLAFDRDAVLFGAATHDLGKVLHHNEITGHGNQHEADGPSLLVQNGVSAASARFTRTHARWNEPAIEIEDLLVALADSIWKGKRHDELEQLVVGKIAAAVKNEPWEAWSKLDEVLTAIAARSDERLEMQGRVAT